MSHQRLGLVDGVSITVNPSTAAVPGSNYHSIQDAVNFFKGKKVRGCTITVSAGTYTEALDISDIETSEPGDLLIDGDQRGMVGQAFTHHASFTTSNPQNLAAATYGTTTQTIALSHAAVTVTVTNGGANNPDFDAVGFGAVAGADTLLTRDLNGTLAETSVTSATNNAIVLSGALAANLNANGCWIVPLPNVMIRQTSNGTAIVPLPNVMIRQTSNGTAIVTARSNCQFKGIYFRHNGNTAGNTCIDARDCCVNADRCAMYNCQNGVIAERGRFTVDTNQIMTIHAASIGIRVRREGYAIADYVTMCGTNVCTCFYGDSSGGNIHANLCVMAPAGSGVQLFDGAHGNFYKSWIIGDTGMTLGIACRDGSSVVASNMSIDADSVATHTALSVMRNSTATCTSLAITNLGDYGIVCSNQSYVNCGGSAISGAVTNNNEAIVCSGNSKISSTSETTISMAGVAGTGCTGIDIQSNSVVYGYFSITLAETGITLIEGSKFVSTDATTLGAGAARLTSALVVNTASEAIFGYALACHGITAMSVTNDSKAICAGANTITCTTTGVTASTGGKVGLTGATTIADGGAGTGLVIGANTEFDVSGISSNGANTEYSLAFPCKVVGGLDDTTANVLFNPSGTNNASHVIDGFDVRTDITMASFNDTVTNTGTEEVSEQAGAWTVLNGIGKGAYVTVTLSAPTLTDTPSICLGTATNAPGGVPLAGTDFDIMDAVIANAIAPSPGTATTGGGTNNAATLYNFAATGAVWLNIVDASWGAGEVVTCESAVIHIYWTYIPV